MLDLDPYISKTPGFPKQGITFYDISPALEDPLILKQACAALCDLAAPMQPNLVAGIDARGFLFAVPVATDRDCGAMSAAANLIDMAGGSVTGAICLIELTGLKARETLAFPVASLQTYEY